MFRLLRSALQRATTSADVLAKIIYVGDVPTASLDGEGDAVEVLGVTAANWDPTVKWTGHDLTLMLDDATTYDPYVFAAALGGGTGVIKTDEGAADFTWAQLKAAVELTKRWKLILVGALPTDNVYTHSGTKDDVTDIVGATDNGRACYDSKDGTQMYGKMGSNFRASVCLGPEALGAEAGHLLGRISEGTPVGFERDTTNLGDKEGSSQPWQVRLRDIIANGTFATATGAMLLIYEATQTASREVFRAAAAATTVDKQVNQDDWGGQAWEMTPGKRVIVRYVCGSNGTAFDVGVAGDVGFAEAV